jgi:hypothetical protein
MKVQQPSLQPTSLEVKFNKPFVFASYLLQSNLTNSTEPDWNYMNFITLIFSKQQMLGSTWKSRRTAFRLISSNHVSTTYWTRAVYWNATKFTHFYQALVAVISEDLDLTKFPVLSLTQWPSKTAWHGKRQWYVLGKMRSKTYGLQVQYWSVVQYRHSAS